MSYIFHPLFQHAQNESFIGNLNLEEKDEKTLVSARLELEKAITDGFKAARARNKDTDIQIPMPKFAMQGSYVYKTLNSPAYPPEQQVDIDLGVYLPFTALGDGHKPKTHAKLYFDTIESILREHISSRAGNTWELSTKKDTCVRVIISPRLHIDLPLYAVPDDQLNRVHESRNLAKSHPVNDGLIFASDDWADLPIEPTTIHLAHKTKGWEPSDALVIRDWVKAQYKNKGAEIRFVCRYLKAWRDEKWKSGGGPSSIFLLAHVIDTFENTSNKHCDLLENAINTLPLVFNQPLLIPRPTPENPHATEDLCSPERISEENKTTYIAAFTELKNAFQQARDASSPSEANEILIRLFGNRLPYDPPRIKDDEPPTDPTRREQVLFTPPERKPLRSTDRSTSG